LTGGSVLPNNEQTKNINRRRPLGPSKNQKGRPLVNKSPPRRRPPKIDTERMAAIRASARHLKDLRRAHDAPPADVAVNTRGIPRLIAPILEQSYCTSPAALCAELAEPPARARPVEPPELAEPAQ
jgi:hypothetical protein